MKAINYQIWFNKSPFSRNDLINDVKITCRKAMQLKHWRVRPTSTWILFNYFPNEAFVCNRKRDYKWLRQLNFEIGRISVVCLLFSYRNFMYFVLFLDYFCLGLTVTSYHAHSLKPMKQSACHFDESLANIGSVCKWCEFCSGGKNESTFMTFALLTSLKYRAKFTFIHRWKCHEIFKKQSQSRHCSSSLSMPINACAW